MWTPRGQAECFLESRCMEKYAQVDASVALHGDPPRGEDKWEATVGGFRSVQDLVRSS